MNYDAETGYIKNSTIRSEYAQRNEYASNRLQEAAVTRATLGSGAVESRAIPLAFSSLENEVGRLSEIICHLNNRLRPVSSPECPRVQEDDGKIPKGADVPMVSAINVAKQSLRDSIETLEDIIKRLEI